VQLCLQPILALGVYYFIAIAAFATTVFTLYYAARSHSRVVLNIITLLLPKKGELKKEVSPLLISLAILLYRHLYFSATWAC